MEVILNWPLSFFTVLLDTSSEAFRRQCSRKSLSVDPSWWSKWNPITHLWDLLTYLMSWKESSSKPKKKELHSVLYYYSPFNYVSWDSVLMKQNESIWGQQMLAKKSPVSRAVAMKSRPVWVEEGWKEWSGWVGLCKLLILREKEEICSVLLPQNLQRFLLHRTFQYKPSKTNKGYENHITPERKN